MTVLYALEYLWAGALLALIIGVLDGLDGKLVRLKGSDDKSRRFYSLSSPSLRSNASPEDLFSDESVEA